MAAIMMWLWMHITAPCSLCGLVGFLCSDRSGQFPPLLSWTKIMFFSDNSQYISEEVVNFAVHAVGDVRADTRQQCVFLDFQQKAADLDSTASKSR